MITIKNSHIRIIGYSLLIINILVFFLAWLRWFIGIPAVILLIIGFFKLIKVVKNDDRVITISKTTLILIVGIITAWVLISGVGGAFPQKADLNWRNAILHDLINYSWPVRYVDGFDSSLTYYFAFWLVPALIGKLIAFLIGAQAGWIASNIAYALYCACILIVVMLLILSHLKVNSLKKMLLAVAILIFFSGMDIVPYMLIQAGGGHFSLGTHLEWWTYIQYSSNTTQLCWVFNQAVPAWLVTSLLLHERKMNHFAFLGVLLLAYGPITFIGVCFLMVLYALQRLLRAFGQHTGLQAIKEILSVPNCIAVAVVLPIYTLFYSSNSAASNNGFGLNKFMILVYLLFILFEFLIYAISVWRECYKKPYFIFSVIGLLLVPLFTIGNEQDFCMRASIPLLFILMVNVSDYLLNNMRPKRKGKLPINAEVIPLIFCLVLGAATPLVEYRDSCTQIMESGRHCTSIYADKIGTLGNANLKRDNFITKNASKTPFYKYIARDAHKN